MSTRLEFEGKSVEKAVQKACEELDIPKEKLKHDVISYGSSGIFGLVGTKKARIRVILPEPTPVADPETPVIGKPNGSSQKQEMKVESASIHATLNDFEISRFPDDPVDLGRSVLQNIIDRITTDAQISVEESSERILFNVEGGNAAVLIGKRGQTIESTNVSKQGSGYKSTLRVIWKPVEPTCSSLPSAWRKSRSAPENR